MVWKVKSHHICQTSNSDLESFFICNNTQLQPSYY